MKIQVMVLALSMIFLVGSKHPSPPDTLVPHIENEELSSPDFRWMRGAFPEASAEERLEYQAITAWLEDCTSLAHLEVMRTLKDLGIENSALEKSAVTYPLCAQVSAQPNIEQFTSYDDFSATFSSTKPIFDAMVSTAWLAENIAGPPTDSLTDQLLHRPMAEQIYRNAYRWVLVDQPNEGVPDLDEKQGAIFAALLTRKLIEEDRANTNWLKTKIDESGWPTKSSVGEDASRKAWLLAQHADHDPVFQLRVLRILEPLVDAGEVSAKDYAYLYDRVMLKIEGRQKYATQVTCEDGIRIPLPLEDANMMPEYRQSVGLRPIADYLAMFSSPCPSD